MILRLFLGDGSFLDQHLDVAVIARPAQHLAVTHLVDAAVADVRPERTAFLYQADRAGRARPEVDGDVGTHAHDFVVGTRERHVEKALWIENRLLCFDEQVLHGLESGLRGHGAVRVTAHAIKHEQECGIFGYHDRSPILVVLAIPERGHFGVFDLHKDLSCVAFNSGHSLECRPSRKRDAGGTIAARVEKDCRCYTV